ncbi:HU family DNA-binding protein [Wolbachia endosymbiont of Ctenocephalides felis wCfeT]|uniref:HU family DNA-binding protein n=1 Tax=Wolbachia endosymbiont of Ctenocephalides felis wCfeT TaxID=2732593 RepID=UPI0014457AA5|nr:HU family DNA-binding protein [Wolbachia endosymbiont of Ctenocephalides felis wCfeT]
MAKKSDIIANIAKKHPVLDKVAITAIIDKFFEVLSDALRNHNRIEIRGFGSLSIRSYNLNNLVSQKFTKNQYFKTYFRTSKKLSDLINGN